MKRTPPYLKEPFGSWSKLPLHDRIKAMLNHIASELKFTEDEKEQVYELMMKAMKQGVTSGKSHYLFLLSTCAIINAKKFQQNYFNATLYRPSPKADYCLFNSYDKRNRLNSTIKKDYFLIIQKNLHIPPNPIPISNNLDDFAIMPSKTDRR